MPVILTCGELEAGRSEVLSHTQLGTLWVKGQPRLHKNMKPYLTPSHHTQYTVLITKTPYSIESVKNKGQVRQCTPLIPALEQQRVDRLSRALRSWVNAESKRQKTQRMKGRASRLRPLSLPWTFAKRLPEKLLISSLCFLLPGQREWTWMGGHSGLGGNVSLAEEGLK